MRLLALPLVAFLLAGCIGTDSTSSPGPGISSWDEPWRDGGGNEVQEHVVSTYEADCVDDAVFLALGWPLGTRFDTIDEAREYVRDPSGHLETNGSLDTAATLPESARNTGYHLGELELWLGLNAKRAAYLVHGVKVERWPRLVEGVGCV